MTTYETALGAVKETEDRRQLQRALLDVIRELNGAPETGKFGPSAPPTPKMKPQPNKARLTLCIMASMVLGPLCQHFVGWGPSLLYSVGWCGIFAITGVMLKPEDAVPTEENKKGLWYRIRPYLFPALYWSQDKQKEA